MTSQTKFFTNEPIEDFDKHYAEKFARIRQNMINNPSEGIDGLTGNKSIDDQIIELRASLPKDRKYYVYNAGKGWYHLIDVKSGLTSIKVKLDSKPKKRSPIGLKLYALLMTIAIILILIPEPITTSLGIVLKVFLAYIGLRYVVIPLVIWVADWIVKISVGIGFALSALIAWFVLA